MMQCTKITTHSRNWLCLFVLSFISLTGWTQVETISDGLGPSTNLTNYKAHVDIINQNGEYGFAIGDSIFDIGTYDKITPLNRKSYLLLKDNKYGLANQNGQLFVQPLYDTIYTDMHNAAFYVKIKDKYGALDSSGAIVLPLKYNFLHYANATTKLFLTADKKGHSTLFGGDDLIEMTNYSKGTFYPNFALLIKDGKYGVWHEGKLTVPTEYDSIYAALTTIKKTSQIAETNYSINRKNQSKELIVLKGDKNGLVKLSGEFIFQPNLDVIKYHFRTNYYLARKGEKVGAYIQSSFTLPCEYDYIHDRLFGYFTVIKNGKDGLFNFDGEKIFPCEYDKFEIYNYNKLKITKGEKIGLADKDGNEILPVKYDQIIQLNRTKHEDQLYLVTENGLSGIVTSTQTIVPLIFDAVLEQNNFFITHLNGFVGLYYANGQALVDPIYDRIYSTVTKRSQIMIIEKEGKKGFIDRKGQEFFMGNIIMQSYITNSEHLNSPYTPNKTASYLRIQGKEGKWGVFDELKPALCVPIIYDEIVQKLDLHKSSYFIVRKDKKMGVLNAQNEVLIPLIYEDLNFNFLRSPIIEKESDIKVVAKKNNKYGLIDLEQNILIPFTYNIISRIGLGDLYKVKDKAGYLIVNSKHEIINPGPFDHVGDFESGIALTFKNGEMRTIDERGKFLIDAKPMGYHEGYHTFAELKQALINALNSKKDDLLIAFAQKITPSKHLLYLMSKLSHTYAYIEYLSPLTINKRYLEVLLQIKSQWNANQFDQSKLISVEDYTTFNGKIYINQRTEEHTFGMRELEWILRDCIRLDGFWVSTFFLKHAF